MSFFDTQSTWDPLSVCFSPHLPSRTMALDSVNTLIFVNQPLLPLSIINTRQIFFLTMHGFILCLHSRCSTSAMPFGVSISIGDDTELSIYLDLSLYPIKKKHLLVSRPHRRPSELSHWCILNRRSVEMNLSKARAPALIPMHVLDFHIRCSV